MKNNTRHDADSIKDGDSVLIISHKQTEINSTTQLLQAAGYSVLSCGDNESAVNMLSGNNIKTILLNSGLQVPSCDELVDILIGTNPGIPLILTDIMSTSDSDLVLRSVRKGIFDFIISPYDSEELLMSVTRAILHYHQEKAKNTVGRASAEDLCHPEDERQHQAVCLRKRTGDDK